MRRLCALLVSTAALTACGDRPAAPTPIPAPVVPRGEIARITAGSSVRLTIDTFDDDCGLEAEFNCRLVRVTATSPGTLTVQAIAEDPWVPGVAAAIRPWDSCCMPPMVERTMATGEEVDVDVLVPWTARRAVTVLMRTWLAPGDPR